jgi:hypothetical protein
MAWKLGSLHTARDPAAVIDYRLDLTRANTHHPGPLPWLPGIPSQLLTDPSWGPYLQSPLHLTEELAAETLDAVTDQTPGWAPTCPTSTRAWSTTSGSGAPPTTPPTPT